MKISFNLKPKIDAQEVKVQELFGRTYTLKKRVEATPDLIEYTIFREDGDAMISCTLSFSIRLKDSDKNYLMDYATLDETMAISMFRHLKRNLMNLQNTIQLKRIKLEKEIAKEKAKKGK